MDLKYLHYFDSMQPGTKLNVSQAQDQPALIKAAKQYIDQTGLLEFNSNYTTIKRLYPFHEEVEMVFKLDQL